MRPGDGTGEQFVRRVEVPVEDILRQITSGAAPGMTRRGVLRFTNRHIRGLLDLRAMELPYALEFVGCHFEVSPDLRQARLASCEFNACTLPGLDGRNLRSDLDVRLVECRVTGTVDLRNGDFGGSLDLQKSRLTDSGDALWADRLRLAGELIGTDLVAEGAIRLRRLSAAGSVTFAGASLLGVLDLDGARVGGDFQCGEGRFHSVAPILLSDAEIGGRLSLRGATLNPSHDLDIHDWHGDTRLSVVADRIRVSGDVDLSRGFTSTGTVRMVNARVGASIRVSNATIDMSKGVETFSTRASESGPYEHRALNLAGTQVAGDVDGRDAHIAGQVRLTALAVRGDLQFDGAVLANPLGDVVDGRQVTVGGDVEVRGALVFGSVLLPEMRTGANLDLRSSRFVAPARYRRDLSLKPSVDLEAAHVGRDLVCAGRPNSTFIAHGAVRLRHAEAERLVTFQDAELGSRLTGTAVDAAGLVTQELRVDVATPPRGRVHLRHARCATLKDNDRFWDATGHIELDDFRYETLAEPVAPDDSPQVAHRLRLLRNALGDEYRPSPYDQLAATLRDSGVEKHAAAVQVAKQRHRYEALASSYQTLGPLVLLWSVLQRIMAGYGFRPFRAFLPLVLLAAGIVGVADASAGMVRTNLLIAVILLGFLLVSTAAAGVTHRLTALNPRTVAPEPRAVVAPSLPPLLSAPVDDALQTIAVDAYLDTDDAVVARAVFTALDDLVDCLGYERPEREFVERGSWFRRASAKVRKGLTSSELAERLAMVEQTIKITVLGAKQAEVDVKTAEAIARLAASLEPVSQGCLRAGSVLVIKFQGDDGPVLLSRNLSPLEMRALERYPEIQTKPRQVLDSLATAVDTLDGDIDPPA